MSQSVAGSPLPLALEVWCKDIVCAATEVTGRPLLQVADLLDEIVGHPAGIMRSFSTLGQRSFSWSGTAPAP